MPPTVAGIHLTGDHASRPAADASGLPIGALYECTDHELIYITDGAAWSTWLDHSELHTEDHASRHLPGGGDALDLELDDLSDVDTSSEAPAEGDFMRYDSYSAEWKPVQLEGGLGAHFDSPAADDQVALRIPFDCDITGAYAIGDQSGSITVDVWVDTQANSPATDADSITASAPITITTDTESSDETLTGWTVALSKGDWLIFNVDSASGFDWAAVQLAVERT